MKLATSLRLSLGTCLFAGLLIAFSAVASAGAVDAKPLIYRSSQAEVADVRTVSHPYRHYDRYHYYRPRYYSYYSYYGPRYYRPYYYGYRYYRPYYYYSYYYPRYSGYWYYYRPWYHSYYYAPRARIYGYYGSPSYHGSWGYGSAWCY